MNATSAPHEQADAWNRANPIGTRVTAYPGTNRITSARIATRTRSTAWVVGDHTAVAAVVGYPGGIALTHLDVVTSNEAIDVAHLEQQRAWSRATFGSGPRTLGVLEHIRKELAEIEAAPADVEEWVDVIILALDGAWRAGWEPQQIIDAIKAKQAKNEARTWPDWRTMSEDQPIEHVQAGR